MIGRHSISFCAVFMLISCAHSLTEKPNYEGRWEVIELMRVDVETLMYPGHLRNAPWFDIKESKFSGFDGCNSFSGTWEFRGDKIKFNKGVQTLIACVSPEGTPTMDTLFNEAVDRNLVAKYDGKGSYSIVTDLPPELREWNVEKNGNLELLKAGKVVLRAKPLTAN